MIIKVQLKPTGTPTKLILKKIPRALFTAILFFSTLTAAQASENVVSLRGVKLEIGGELELEMIDSARDGTAMTDVNGKGIGGTNNSFPRMSIDKIVITPKVQLSSDILFKADIEFGPDKPVKLDEAWIKISGLPLNSWITFGQEDPFIHVSRKTESYPILGHAFWQDEDLGAFAGGRQASVYWRFSMTNGRRLKDRQAGEDKVFPITTDDDDNVENNGNKQIGIGLGLNHAFKAGHSIDLLPFWYTADLSPQDISYLNKIKNYTGGNDDTQTRYGLNLDYVLRGFSFFAQYMGAQDGGMDRDGWYVQPSFKQKLGMSRLKSLEFLVRYEEYNVDLVPAPSDSRTWDRQVLTVAVTSEIVRGFKVKTEYYLKDEDTGGEDVNNDEFLMQLEVKF